VFSSRKIARKLYEDVAFRMLSGGSFPAHRTIADFRLRHLRDFESVFLQVVKIAKGAGLVKVGTVIVDGSKVKANASKHKAMTYARMTKEEKRLEREIRALLKRARRVDAEEDREFGPECSGHEVPEELARRETRLAKIQEAKKQLEERQAAEDRAKGRSEDDDTKPKRGRRFKRAFGVPPDDKQTNFTDPESRIMKANGGYEQCYNGQVAVDEESLLIVATGVTQNASDAPQLKPMAERAASNLGENPRVLLADAGYRSEENCKWLEKQGIDSYISLGREDKVQARPNAKYPALRRMHQKLRTNEGRGRYRRRKVAESVFGRIKAMVGFRSFSLRGVSKVTAEWDLVASAVNLLRMHRMMPGREVTP
jgi:hypothetical protein